MDIITVKDAASILGVTSGTVYDLVAAKKIGHYRVGVGRGSIRFRRADVEDYLESCFREPSSPDVPEKPKSRRKSSPRGLKFLGHCRLDARPV